MKPKPPPSNPSWTTLSRDPFEHRGLWALGLEPVGLNIEARLLSRFTGTTVEIRYYSFFCWVFWTLRQKHLLQARDISLADQSAWIIRLENAFRAASLIRNPKIQQLVGVLKARGIETRPLSESIDVSKGYAATAFTPAQYSASFTGMGLGGNTGLGLVRLTHLGERLAKAFDKQLVNSPKGQAAKKLLVSDRKRLPLAFLHHVGSSFVLRSIRPGEPEHGPLVEMLFRLDRQELDTERDRSADRARSKTLGLLLEIARQSHGTIEKPYLVHKLLTSGCLPSGKPFRVPSIYRREFATLQRYQERQSLKLGLYGLWRAATLFLDHRLSKTAPPESIIEDIRRAVRGSPTAATWLGPAPLNLKLPTVLKRIKEQFTVLNRNDRPVVFEMLNLLQARTPEAESERAGVAVVLLFITMVRWKEISKSGALPDDIVALHAAGTRQRISLASLINDTDARLDLTLGEYLAWLVTTCVLSQAVQVATAKLRRGQFRYFVLRDEDGYRLVRRQRMGSYLIFDGGRIRSGYRLLRGLRLVTTSHGINITRHGIELLRTLRSAHRDPDSP